MRPGSGTSTDPLTVPLNTPADRSVTVTRSGVTFHLAVSLSAGVSPTAKSVADTVPDADTANGLRVPSAVDSVSSLPRTATGSSSSGTSFWSSPTSCGLVRTAAWNGVAPEASPGLASGALERHQAIHVADVRRNREQAGLARFEQRGVEQRPVGQPHVGE